MADGIVATRAVEACGFAVNNVAVDRRGDRFVAAAACVLGDPVIEFRDLDSVGIMPAGEIKRMPEAVVGLDGILSDQVVGSVAVVAGRDRMMAGLHPGVVLRLHDMAIRAGRRIIREIRVSLGVDKCVAAKPESHSQQNGGRDADCNRTLHVCGFKKEHKRIRLKPGSGKCVYSHKIGAACEFGPQF